VFTRCHHSGTVYHSSPTLLHLLLQTKQNVQGDRKHSQWGLGQSLSQNPVCGALCFSDILNVANAQLTAIVVTRTVGALYCL